jgi:hypothetical protein
MHGEQQSCLQDCDQPGCMASSNFASQNCDQPWRVKMHAVCLVEKILSPILGGGQGKIKEF